MNRDEIKLLKVWDVNGCTIERTVDYRGVSIYTVFDDDDLVDGFDNLADAKRCAREIIRVQGTKTR